jgi:hypothetical protein
MADEKKEHVINLHRDTLDACIKEYQEMSDTWRHLDSKAEATITVSGIILGAVFVLIQARLGNNIFLRGPYDKHMIATAIILLNLSIFFAILTIRVRRVSMGITGEDIQGMANDLIQSLEYYSTDRIANYYKDQFTICQNAINEIRNANDSKAANLTRSHWTILAAMILLMIISIKSIF